MTHRTSFYDAVIVGARCAGAATALLLARQGARVMVIDHGEAGTDTVSTHAIMPTGVFLLRQWGVLDRLVAAGTPAIRRQAFLYGDREIARDVAPGHGLDALYAPRRQVLDLALVEAAREAGAEFRFGTGCRGLAREGARVHGVTVDGPRGPETLSAGIVIGADGRRSMVARQVGAETLRTAEKFIGCIYAYVEDHGQDGFRFHHDHGAAGGIIPTNDGRACVFVALPPEQLRAERKAGPVDPLTLAARFVPQMARDLEGARMVTAPVIWAGEPGYVRASAGPGWALAGDAGHFRDPCTAHGISDALRDAELLSAAIAAGDVARYPAQRDAMSAKIFALTERVAGLDWSMETLLGHHIALHGAMQGVLEAVAGGDVRALAA